MLHYISQMFKRSHNKQVGGGAPEGTEITKHIHEVSHLFTLNGTEINSLKEIDPNVDTLVACMSRIFKGVIDSEKLVTYQG